VSRYTIITAPRKKRKKVYQECRVRAQRRKVQYQCEERRH